MHPDNLNNPTLAGYDFNIPNQIATPRYKVEGFDKKTKNHHRYFLSFIGLITLFAILFFSQDSMPTPTRRCQVARVNKLLTIS